MGMYIQQVPVKFKTLTAPVGSYTYLDTMSYPYPISVSAIVGSGGSVTVQYSTTPQAAVLQGTANWFTWPSGTVTANTNDYVKSPVSALRFTAATTAGTVEVAA